MHNIGVRYRYYDIINSTEYLGINIKKIFIILIMVGTVNIILYCLMFEYY